MIVYQLYFQQKLSYVMSLRQELAAILMDHAADMRDQTYRTILDQFAKIPDHRDPVAANELQRELNRIKDRNTLLHDALDHTEYELQHALNEKIRLEKSLQHLTDKFDRLEKWESDQSWIMYHRLYLEEKKYRQSQQTLRQEKNYQRKLILSLQQHNLPIPIRPAWTNHPTGASLDAEQEGGILEGVSNLFETYHTQYQSMNPPERYVLSGPTREWLAQEYLRSVAGTVHPNSPTFYLNQIEADDMDTPYFPEQTAQMISQDLVHFFLNFQPDG